MPLPLRHKIPQGSTLSLGANPLALPQALERIAQGSLWLEEGADLLRTEAFRMLMEQGDNPARPTRAPGLPPRA
jgi:hypothetical protein